MGKQMSVIGIRAEKTILCGPPAIWQLEIAAAVCPPNQPEEIIYLSMCEIDSNTIQIARKSYFEAIENELPDIDIIQIGETAAEIQRSEYRELIEQTFRIFERITNP